MDLNWSGLLTSALLLKESRKKETSVYQVNHVNRVPSEDLTSTGSLLEFHSVSKTSSLSLFQDSSLSWK